ncbi:nucleotide exchange factor GrpE [uncultured Marivirga sp.]|uniref:nucleotide exchange factor GrpE n=1 Tax=uncultured Marivirga sp. TaxID=1123707 RepID=UPI0030EC2447|tara:strand:+ start:233113 stop:233724 length:612 start_codon:yes stop_codon:yes gene_type:complete
MAKEELDEKELNKEAETAEDIKDEQNAEDETQDNRSEEEKSAEAEAQAKDEELSDFEKLEIELAESKDKFLRLYSEFENFRRRNAKERLELVKNASEELISDLLPIMDDFERAEKSFEDQSENEAVKEGFTLIKNKFEKTLINKGLKAMDNDAGIEFDPEIHEAITKIPAPDEKLKGKVVDVVEKGYLLNDKVIRFAKVVIGE